MLSKGSLSMKGVIVCVPCTMHQLPPFLRIPPSLPRQYVADLESFVSVSADSTMNAYDIIKGVHKDTYRFHSRPLHCFTWLSGACPPPPLYHHEQ